MQLFLVLLLAGGVGSLCRFGLGSWIERSLDTPAVPWGTVAVNTLGCLLFGFVFVCCQERGALDKLWCKALLVGFLGAFTTFSTFAFQAIDMLQRGQGLLCVSYLMGQCLLGCVAVWSGMRLGSA